MAATFKIGTTEYIQYVASMRWSRNDIDEEDSGRTMDGIMHRSRVAVKRKLSVTLRPMTQSELSSIVSAIEPEFITVTHSDPVTGSKQTTFYGSTVESGILFVRDGVVYWEDTTFNLIEK